MKQLIIKNSILTPVLSVIRADMYGDKIHLLIDHNKTKATLDYLDVDGGVFAWILNIWLEENNIDFKCSGKREKFEQFHNGEPIWDIIIYGKEETDIEHFINNLQ